MHVEKNEDGTGLGYVREGKGGTRLGLVREEKDGTRLGHVCLQHALITHRKHVHEPTAVNSLSRLARFTRKGARAGGMP